MQKKYNNPFLEVERMKEDLNTYIERTRPKNQAMLIDTQGSSIMTTPHKSPMKSSVLKGS